MTGIEAPFQTATELTGQPAEAALGGVQQNFDPANKDPLHALQEAQVRLDTEAAAKLQQQRQFEQQRQQQFREQQHDILTKHMAYDHEDKVLKANRALKDRQDLFSMFNQTGGTSATLKDEQGNDMSIPLLPQDQKQLDDATNSFQKIVMADPTGYKNNPELWKQMNDLKHQRTNASMRSIYLRQAQQQLQGTYDPAEQEKLKGYMEKIQSTPLDEKNPPMPYIQQAQVKPVLDLAKYKEGKGFESFDDGSGIPNAEYQKLLTTTNPNDINEGFKRFQFFQQQPQGQSAAAYKDYQDHLNELTDARGLPRIELGGVPTADGKILFDADTYAKKQALAKNYLAATELLNSGHLKNPDEEDVLKSEKTKAEIEKIKSQTNKIGKTGKAQMPQSAQQIENQKASEQTVGRIKSIFKADRYPGTSEVREKNSAKDLDGLNEALKNKGYKPSDWVAVGQPPPSDVQDLSGVEERQADKQGVFKGSGQTEKTDKVIALKNKTTGEISLGFFRQEYKDKDRKTPILGKYTLQSLVNGRAAVENAAKHKHQYSENKDANDEINRNKSMYEDSQIQSANPTGTVSGFQPKYNGDDVQVKNDGGIKKAFVDGAWKKIISRNSKTGEIKVE